VKRAAVAAAIASLVGAFALAAAPAEAHLIPARQGTINLVGDAAFVVLSVPVSSLPDADENHDGLVDMEEFTRHEGELRAAIDRRLVVSDGATPATTVRVDLVLSPQHEAARDRADQIVVLKHARFAAPPTDLRVRCDLFGQGPTEQEFSLTATRHPPTGKETEVAVLAPGSPEHAFFTPPGPPPAPIRSLPRGLLPIGAVAAFGVAFAWVGWSRARKATAPPR
jgi:hypothetical protein